MKFGVIAMSAKPYHKGHDLLIRKAAKECDKLFVFVSISDRRRADEPVVLGKDMHDIWIRHIAPSLPENVELVYGGSPVGNVYKFIGDEGEAGSTDDYVIFSDPDDLDKSFPPQSLEKYFGDLYRGGHVIVEPVHRSETVDVSGTQMRSWIDNNEKERFIEMLPQHIAKDPTLSTNVWNRLRSSSVNVKRRRARKR